MKNPEREKSLERIKQLHQALRYAGCGAAMPGFAHLKLGAIANELRARIEVEALCSSLDLPSDALFLEMVEKGKQVVKDNARKECRPNKHELN